MRRALAGIVPEEILNRKRKASVSRGPIVELNAAWPRLRELSHEMVSASLGFVDANSFLEALHRARHGRIDCFATLFLTLRLELWLRDLVTLKVLSFQRSELDPSKKPILVAQAT